MKRVVVAIDGSETSKCVVDYAIYYANREQDAEMLFLHVITPMEHERVAYGAGRQVLIPPSEEKVKAEFTKFVQERIDAAGKSIPRMSVFIASGNMYGKIASFAEEQNADMIMIGHRGSSPMETFFLGCVGSESSGAGALRRQRSSPEGSSPVAAGESAFFEGLSGTAGFSRRWKRLIPSPSFFRSSRNDVTFLFPPAPAPEP